MTFEETFWDDKPKKSKKKSKKQDPKPRPKPDLSINNFPFRILGTSDDHRAFFLGRNERLIDVPMSGMTKNYLLNLAPIEWWRENFGHGTAVYWDDAIDFMILVSGSVDFDQSIIRGRGAWRERDGRICYFDGKDITGEYSKKRLYVRLAQKDIGLNAEPADPELTNKIVDIVQKMSFETKVDCLRLLSWSALAPFAGALPWRPAILLTGSSSSGKSEIIDKVVRPIAMPRFFSGGETTEAGVRQQIKHDAAPIVIEEAEGETPKKKSRREDLFSLMRQSTTDNAPKVAKGTADGRGQFFELKSMFLFAAISPEVEYVADDNRIFRVSVKKPDKTGWTEIERQLIETITPENCNRIRALVWKRLKYIIETAKLLIPTIQHVTKKDSRYSLADGILIATYFLIWKNVEDLDLSEYARGIDQIYDILPPEESRDETVELIDRLLDERIQIDAPRREQISIREILTIIHSGIYKDFSDTYNGDGYDKYVTHEDISYLKNVVSRYGIGLIGKGSIAISTNHHEIMKILGKGRGYHKQLARHPNCIDKSRVVYLANKSRRCVVFDGILEEKGE